MKFSEDRERQLFSVLVLRTANHLRKFAEAGYNFVSISYQDDDEFKSQAIEDFSRPDTEIHGLIATDLLTKDLTVLT